VTGLIQPEIITGGPRERELLLAELDRELAVARSGSGTSTPRVDSPAPFRQSRPPLQSTASGRRRGPINYAEKASDDEDSEDEEEDLTDVQEAASDPDDADYGSKSTRRRGDRDRDASQGVAGASTPIARPWSAMGPAEQQATIRAGKLKRKKDDMERGFTWLGDRVPGERVRSRAKGSTKLEIRFVFLPT
jgi:chromatin structure-remodeling complex subunit SFH1